MALTSPPAAAPSRVPSGARSNTTRHLSANAASWLLLRKPRPDTIGQKRLRANFAGGYGMMLGTAAAGYAGGSFLAPAIGFDEEMSRVQALTRLNKDSSQMGICARRLKNSVQKLHLLHEMLPVAGVSCNGWLYSRSYSGCIAWRSEYGAGWRHGSW
ncbi:Uncharacterised protein [Yokenella regensburgei]|uniref:Uncharacterized protein n=1 Tax=Yokenella regensburgei TaxID=158877 RepID=A0AB38FXB7_9ENTR|nr:Uncharacterised protein [Yokenella regensburgei]